MKISIKTTRKVPDPQAIEVYGIVRFKRPDELGMTRDIEVSAMGLWWNNKNETPPPKEQKGGTIKHVKRWRDWHASINDTRGHLYYLSVFNFICNRNYIGDEYWPDPERDFDDDMMAEPVTGSGNIHRVIGECATHWMLESISNRTDPAELNGRNWQNDRRFFKCAAQKKKEPGKIFNVQDGVDCHAALLREGENQLWIWKDSLELLKQPPFVVDGQTVIRYEIQGASVIAITTSGNRFYLLKCTKPGEREFPYADEWSLKAQSVIPTAL